jgi:hypothetical protein
MDKSSSSRSLWRHVVWNTKMHNPCGEGQIASILGPGPAVAPALDEVAYSSWSQLNGEETS